eukprot:6481719-Amphidinium_carterae.1
MLGCAGSRSVASPAPASACVSTALMRFSTQECVAFSLRRSIGRHHQERGFGLFYSLCLWPNGSTQTVLNLQEFLHSVDGLDQHEMVEVGHVAFGLLPCHMCILDLARLHIGLWCVIDCVEASTLNGAYLRQQADGEFSHWAHETRSGTLEQDWQQLSNERVILNTKMQKMCKRPQNKIRFF